MTARLLSRLRAAGASSLAGNTLWNLAGLLTPLLAALIAIPYLVAALGLPRFGILTLGWAVVGYFGVFDLGLGRALTQRLASALGEGGNDSIASLARTGLLMLACLGLVGATCAWLLTPFMAGSLFDIPAELVAESRSTFYLLAVSVPMVVVTTGLRGILEAYGAFRAVNLVRIPLGVFNYLGPLCVLPFSSSLTAVVAALVAGRVVAGLAYGVLVFRQVPGITRGGLADRAQAGSLLGFGAWMTLSNVIGPLMIFMDRFFIAGYASMAAVAYYATPQEMVMRLGLIPAALMGVLFPAFASAFAGDRALVGYYFERAAGYMLVAMFPLVLVVAVFATEILEFWLGREFAANSATVLQIMLLGILVNSQARLMNTLTQSEGRADITARVHLLELVLYIVALVWVVPRYGVIGAAWVWAGRTPGGYADLCSGAAGAPGSRGWGAAEACSGPGDISPGRGGGISADPAWLEGLVHWGRTQPLHPGCTSLRAS